MKFSKDDALQNLKAQFTTKGKTLKLSDRTMSDTLENLMAFANDETELETFAASAFKTLDSMNGNHIKDTSDFVKTWNEAHPVTVPINPPAPITPPDPLLEVKKMMQDVMQEISGIKAKTKTEQLVQDAERLFSERKPDPKWKGLQAKAKQIVSSRITADMTAEAFSAEWDKEYNELISASGGEGAYIPADSAGGAGGAREGTKEFYAAQRAELVAEGIIKE